MTSELEDALASSTSKLARLKIWEMISSIKDKAVAWKARLS